MMLPTVLSAATFAVAAQAFLLPLEVVETAELSKSLAPFVSQSQELDLDCSACPFALESTRNGLHEWTASQKSDLKLNFATADGKLRLNGVPFYPINFPELPPVLSVKQVAKKDDDETSTMVGKAFPGDLSLSYSLEVNDIKHFANPDEEEADLVSVVMSIMGLDDQMVQVDDIHIKLLKGADSAVSGNLFFFFFRFDGPQRNCKTNGDTFFSFTSSTCSRSVPPGRTANVPRSCAGSSPSSTPAWAGPKRPLSPPPPRLVRRCGSAASAACACSAVPRITARTTTNTTSTEPMTTPCTCGPTGPVLPWKERMITCLRTKMDIRWYLRF